MTRLRLVLFLLVWASCAWFGSWEMNPNNSTRMFAAISLVEDHDATIDEFAPLTIDKAEFDGHAYLDKAPGMTLMAIPAVWIANAVTGERSAAQAYRLDDSGLTRFVRLRMRIAVAMGPALLTAVAAVLLFDMALGLTGSTGGALFAALGYALGSPIWGWSTTVFGHAAVAALYVVAAWAVWRAQTDPKARYAVVAGAALGWAVVVEYQAVLAGGAIALWAIWSLARRPGGVRFLTLAAVAGLVALLPMAAYNVVAFATPFRVGYSGVTGFEGMRQGLFGLGVPRPEVLWEIVFGVRRGLFWVAPVLVLAPLGLWRLRETRRDVAVMAGAVVAIALLVNAAYFYWDGGNATGPRHAMPMVGLLALGLAPFWAGLRSQRAQIAAAGVLALSIAINAAIASAEILAPPEFRFPVWSAVLDLRFANGDLRTVASEWFGWSPWSGFALWAVVAVPALAWMARAATVRRGFS